MKVNIHKIFPEAIIQTQPIFEEDYLCFYNKNSNEFIGIKKEGVSLRERLLLESFLEKVEDTPEILNQTASQQIWYNFLVGKGDIPEKKGMRIRFIHYFVDPKISKVDFNEAIQNFLQDETILVWISNDSGVIIEKESADSIENEDLLSFTEAVLSDFYFPVDLYVGRFFEMNDKLKDHFSREQIYFRTVKPIHPQQHLFYFETSFPFVIMSDQGNQLFSMLYEEYQVLFQNDLELLATIKLFLENNSNTSLTAKKLYLHRNSLQYRIDKFIERTNIDIKAFQGALSVYFICLFGESYTNFEQSKQK